MIFTAPVLRRSSHDQALQRFLQSTLTSPLSRLSEASASMSAAFTATQDEQSTTLQLDVPGLAREQLQLRLEGAQVHLTSVEGAPRKVQRSWELGHEIDVAASSAKLENGVLTLRLAKLAPVDKTVTLNIE
ncbi:Hsp20 family protein [Comamonas antarctica]|uniref:Hsp20 family protein n=1 Tax=Comamonas antarctica TaxID=2743470 RepID=A0A6N1X3Y5_9BURK|nr:Hsp20/alpha crystallin family protein [Comamonas antarctica]QKV52470.1 Hsp20 family protein [Comamonas antarctica]